MKYENNTSDMAFDLRYTICFGIDGDKVLMLLRHKQPNQHYWNGLGGKIEHGELVHESIQREMFEECGVLLPLTSFRLGGVVTWPSQRPLGVRGGMYAFVADMTGQSNTIATTDTPEGRLEWKLISWVCDRQNAQVVSNIPYFLPDMISASEAKLYNCQYKGNVLCGVTRQQLSAEFLLLRASGLLNCK